MASGHSHALPEDKKESTLWIALGLTSSFLIAETVAGLLLNSLALLADAAHMFTDAAALGIALAAVRVAQRPADARRTYGHHRFEILAAAFNALLLFGVAIYILVEAWQRFSSPAAVQPTGMLVVATLGLVINLISMRLLGGGKNSLTAHVVQAESSRPEDVRASLREVLTTRFKVFHTTLQTELTPCRHTDDGCNHVGAAGAAGHGHAGPVPTGAASAAQA